MTLPPQQPSNKNGDLKPGIEWNLRDNSNNLRFNHSKMIQKQGDVFGPIFVVMQKKSLSNPIVLKPNYPRGHRLQKNPFF